ncbi:MAG: sugar ABC transporter permease [Anaerolineae bacterium]|nr:sugar ABC transporter permease [Anaerolineae bacterium]
MVPLGYCTFEAERSDLDRLVGGVLVAVGVVLVSAPALWIAPRLLRGQRLTEPPQSTQGVFRSHWLPWLLLVPTLAILLLFLYYPSVETLRLSTRLARLGARREAFVCVDNFTRLIGNADYLAIVFRTLWMSVAIVGLSMGLALMVAMAAYLPIRGATIYRTLLIWPYGISPAVAGIIFLLMFNPSGGIINHFLGDWLGIKLGWTNDPAVAPWTIILASVWKSIGFNILFYIAGLQNVPKDLLEAASIDGANAVQRFRNVLIPMLSPITFFLIVTNVTYAFFETYATIDYLTPGGGPLGSTTTMMYDVIRVGVTNNDLGKAAAQSIVLFMLVIGLTWLQFRAGGRRVTYGA